MIGKSVSGVDTDDVTAIEGTVESVKWLDGDPKLQIRKADGTNVDLEMGLITLVPGSNSYNNHSRNCLKLSNLRGCLLT